MNNKCNCGCCQTGFVPVSGNWDFNMEGDCGCSQQNRAVRRNRRSACGEYESAFTREREADDRSGCQCERCNDDREAECCGQNTCIREMKDETCECRSRARTSSCGCERETVRARSNGGDCDECTRARSAGCSDCDSCARARNSARSACTCEETRECNARSTCSESEHSRKNRGVGMVNAEVQEIDEIFESESALRAGTLFPELHMPLNGYCPCDENCGTCAQAAAFAAWEMRLYLNTHPNDQEALALFRKLCKEAKEENYATTFLEDDCCTKCWNWVKNPWPWEYSCQCGDQV